MLETCLFPPPKIPFAPFSLLTAIWLASGLRHRSPVLVLFSFFLGPHPMALVFNAFEIGGVILAVLIANQVTSHGESTWYMGVQLLAVYTVLGLAFLFA